MKFKVEELGYTIFESGVRVFFGNKKSSLENLKDVFPGLDWARLKQTHGDQIVEANLNEPLPEADAQISTVTNRALCISTADCIPAMIYDSTSRAVAAVHAGWRGVANRIIPKTIWRLQALGGKPENFKIFLGPHILIDSFEVDSDVRERILSSIEKHPDDFERPSGAGKFKLDLLKVVRQQVLELNVPLTQMIYFPVDTFQSSEFHSYRRDRENSGRQISFIQLK